MYISPKNSHVQSQLSTRRDRHSKLHACFTKTTCSDFEQQRDATIATRNIILAPDCTCASQHRPSDMPTSRPRFILPHRLREEHPLHDLCLRHRTDMIHTRRLRGMHVALQSQDVAGVTSCCGAGHVHSSGGGRRKKSTKET